MNFFLFSIRSCRRKSLSWIEIELMNYNYSIRRNENECKWFYSCQLSMQRPNTRWAFWVASWAALSLLNWKWKRDGRISICPNFLFRHGWGECGERERGKIQNNCQCAFPLSDITTEIASCRLVVPLLPDLFFNFFFFFLMRDEQKTKREKEENTSRSK